MAEYIFNCHPGIGSEVEGTALVAKDNFSARYDLDRINGKFSRKQHKLYQMSYVDRILILDQAKGGVATAWMLAEMKSRGLAPLALVLNASNTIMAQGAAFADLPLIDRFDLDITSQISTGDRVSVLPREGKLILHSESK